MAETRLTNVVVPRVFSAATVEPSIYKSRFFRSGVIMTDPTMASQISGGGKIYDAPFWQDVGGTSGDAPVEGSDQTVNNMAMLQEVYRKHTRTKAWGQNDLSAVQSGENGLTELQNMVIDYWAQAYDIVAFKSMQGIVNDNVDNDSGDLVRDITGNAGTAAYISDDEVIRTTGLIGEAQESFAAIALHPSVYNYLKRLDLIDFMPSSDQGAPIPVYMGMQCIFDRNAYTSAGEYWTHLVKPNVIKFAVTTANHLPTETDRKPLDGFGINQLITRRVFAMHFKGLAWVDGSVSGTTPTDAELAAAAQWNRVGQQENMPFVTLKHKIPS